MRDATLLELLHEAADAVATALAGVADWGPAGTRPGQYRSDLAADAAALDILGRAAVRVLSEESGLHAAGPAAAPDLADVVDRKSVV